MDEEYGSNPKDILVGIGPSIYKCCYEVGDDVANKIKDVIDDWEKVLVKRQMKNGCWICSILTILNL